jgi:hypothetical protein
MNVDETIKDVGAKHEPPNQEAAEAEYPIDELTKLFINHIDSLYEILPLTMMVVAATFKHADEQYRKYVEDSNLKTTNKGGRTVVHVPIEHQHRYHKLANRRDLCGIASSNIPRVFLVSLVSHFDSLLGGLLRAIFYLRAELLNASERLLTFKELSEFGTLADAREFVVEKEIETAIRKSHLEQFDWMEQKFKLPLRKDLPSWPVFLELTERRNLFVHNDGIVSNQYMKMCKEYKFPACQLGLKLEVSRDYFRAAYECVFEIGVKLAHVLWRKLDPDTRSVADTNLNAVCFQLLSGQKYRLAQNLLDFATETLKTYSDDHARRIFVVNRIQAYKWNGDSARAQQLIDAEDWSACGLNFQLAVAVLRDKFNEAAELMKSIGLSSTLVHKQSYQQWPLFKEFRKSEIYKTTFREVFGEAPMRAEAETESPKALPTGQEPEPKKVN